MNAQDLEVLFDVIAAAQQNGTEVEIDQLSSIIDDLPMIDHAKARTFRRLVDYEGITVYFDGGASMHLCIMEE